jgi:hypothetical protein
MEVLYKQLAGKLLPGMTIPEPIRQLYAWIEYQNTYIEQPSGARIGFLFPEAKMKAGWTDSARPGGTNIEFAAGGNEGLEYWFNNNDSSVLNRVCVFAQTGGDGSMAAFWLDDNGTQKIVHLGSGPGSTLVCVLATDPIDFIRLLAIGYDEICWDEEFLAPPNQGDFHVHPNKDFQGWVVNTFKVTIPKMASEIVKRPSKIGDVNPEDEFAQWVESNVK